MIIGIISGLISTGLLYGVYTLIIKSDSLVNFMSKLSLTLLPFTDMIYLVLIVYLLLGIGVGVLGSTISMRKYLKV